MKRNIILGIILACVVVAGSATGAAILFNKFDVQNNLIDNSVEDDLEQDPIKILNGWNKESDVWCFYIDNIKQKDWIQYNNAWYYLGLDGKMRTGWIKDNDQWYYLYDDGTMATNTTIDNCYLNGKGLIEETPTPVKKATETVSTNTTSGVINENEALNIIQRNDGTLISSLNKPKFEFTGMASSDTINYLNNNYENMNINESLYKFALFTYGYDFDDSSELSDPVYSYYVGSNTRKVYRTSGHSVGHMYEMKNNIQSNTYIYKPASF